MRLNIQKMQTIKLYEYVTFYDVIWSLIAQRRKWHYTHSWYRSEKCGAVHKYIDYIRDGRESMELILDLTWPDTNRWPCDHADQVPCIPITSQAYSADLKSRNISHVTDYLAGSNASFSQCCWRSVHALFKVFRGVSDTGVRNTFFQFNSIYLTYTEETVYDICKQGEQCQRTPRQTKSALTIKVPPKKTKSAKIQ